MGAMARSGRQLAEAHRPQLPAQGLLGHPDAVFLPQPLRQIDQPPAHHPMHGRDRAALDHTRQCLALGVVELGHTARRLAVDQTVQPVGIEPQYPITDRLQPDPADPRRVGTRATIVNLGKRQQAPHLLRLARLLRRSPQRRPVEITPQANWSRHGKPPTFAMLNHVTADS
jgi:hypothetical protein